MGIFGFKSNTLYWPGCYSEAKLKSKVGQYRKIMKRLGIGCRVKTDMKCCGGVLINAGYDKEARKLIRENFDVLRDEGVKKIITSCPLCYKTFVQDYESMLPDWDIEVEFILIPVLEKLKNKYSFSEGSEKQKIIYHDPCYLGRYSGIYNEPREILKILGYNVKELAYTGGDSLCSGACGNLKHTDPDLADDLAHGLIKQIRLTGVKTIVTPDPHVYNHLKENLEGSDIEVFEFSDLLVPK